MEEEAETGLKEKPFEPNIHLALSVVMGTVAIMCLGVIVHFENISVGPIAFLAFLTTLVGIPAIVHAVRAAIKADRAEQQKQNNEH